MFELSQINSIRKNPMLAAELVKHLTVYELIDCVSKQKGSDTAIIDHPAIINGIMESEDPAKILYLASSVALSEFTNGEVFEKIFLMGDVFRAALYGNSKIDWYGFFTFRGQQIAETIIKDITSNEQFKIAFYKNPRMDREIIASIISGRNNEQHKQIIDFTKFSKIERYWAVRYSFDANEIKSEYWIGKDSPDSNELNFYKPFAAVLLLIKDILASYDDQTSKNIAERLIEILYAHPIDLTMKDWLTDEQKATYENDKSDDWSQLREKYEQIAFVNLIGFLNKITSNISISCELTGRDDNLYNRVVTEYFAPASLSITILSKILRSYSFAKEAKKIIPILLAADNWVLRAAGYNYIFESIDFRNNDEADLFDKFLIKYGKDKEALSHAFWHSGHVQLFERVRFGFVYYKINEFCNSANINDVTKKYLFETLPYFYAPNPNNINDEVVESFLKKLEGHSNAEFIKSLILKENKTEGKDPLINRLTKSINAILTK